MIGGFRALAQSGGLSRFLFWAAGEVFVVVAGVLIAFGLNAWWGERATRLQEQTHLRALERDFEHNVRLYAALIERAQRSAERSLELLQLARRQPDADPVAVGRLMGGVFQSYREKPALDAYQALVNSAGLTLIHDEDLRGALAGFADRATDPYQERFADQFYMTFMTKYVGRLQIAGSVAQEGTEPQSFVELLTDPAFQEHLAFRSVLEGDVARTYCERWDEAQSLLEQLRAQLETASSSNEHAEPEYCTTSAEPAAADAPSGSTEPFDSAPR